MTAQLTRQLIAQPEGQGVSLTVMIALCVIQEREVQIINFPRRDAFTGVQNAERQTIVGGLIGADFKGDLADLRRGDGILNQHHQDATQGIAIAVTLVVGR